jgi:hypothetical protein
MKYVAVALIASVSAFAFSRKAPDPVPSPSATPVPSPSPTGSPSPVPPGSQRVTFAPVPYYSTEAQRKKTASAGAKMNEVVQSQCFKDFITAQAMNQTKGQTSAQVANNLRTLSGTIPVEFYYARFSSAVAYRQYGLTIHINTKFLGSFSSDCELAATFAHESLGHSLGNYDHPYNWTRAREDTVPYVMGGRKAQYGGDVFDRCCK